MEFYVIANNIEDTVQFYCTRELEMRQPKLPIPAINPYPGPTTLNL